jgi:hypothetical protein
MRVAAFAAAECTDGARNLSDSVNPGVLLESEGQGSFGLIPLDDDLIDFLIEQSPRFRADCHEIRGRMQAGQSQAHEDVRRQLVEE